MIFRISDTFTDSLARLPGEAQKAVKTSAFDLQLNPASPGLQLHKLDRARDPNFWSVRVNADIRLIVHRTAASLLLCYVDHHDQAYAWAAKRKLVTHPQTGAAQLVEIREVVQDIVRAPRLADLPDYRVPQPAQPPLAAEPDASLLAFGVPPEWIAAVKAANEDALLDLVMHLPAEAAEAVLELATGGRPSPPVAVDPTVDPFEHPDALRRFRLVSDVAELERALAFPWDKWMVFLHPAQRQITERDYNGPARVAGSAGTGKTIVALHRAVHLAQRYSESRILLTTFSSTLADSLQQLLRRLISSKPKLAERLEVLSIDAAAARLYASQIGRVRLIDAAQQRAVLESLLKDWATLPVSARFVWGEWSELVDAWQLQSWEDYRDVKRLGRKTRLSETQRALLWQLFTALRERLAESGAITAAAMYTQLSEALRGQQRAPFDFAVVDEAQDLSIAQLRFLAALGGGRPNGLFFAGDLGQRIFQLPFSWKSIGVDIRGRSRTLHVNYRTSQQIRRQADRLLDDRIADVDGEVEDRSGTVSVFQGPSPQLVLSSDTQAEQRAVTVWLRARTAESMAPHELGVFVRSDAQLLRAQAAVKSAGLIGRVLDAHVATAAGQVSIATMFLAKGLEFRAVVVMACDVDVLPLAERIEAIGDEADLEEVYTTERHLLYVACTRAREQLLLSGVAPGSEFLADLG
jgi:mRNA-degrading endonuclease RelE of RelBE toxin-antitoxin system